MSSFGYSGTIAYAILCQPSATEKKRISSCMSHLASESDVSLEASEISEHSVGADDVDVGLIFHSN